MNIWQIQWPLLLPLVSMVAGLAISARTVQTCSLATLLAALICLLLSAVQSRRHLFSACVSLFFFFWGFIQSAQWEGIIRRASIRETSSAKIATFGIIDRNCPIKPVAKRSGIKAAILVSTVANTGSATSFVPLMAASFGAIFRFYGDELRRSAVAIIPLRQ